LLATARLEAAPPHSADPPPCLFRFSFALFFFSRSWACLLFFFPVFCPRRYFFFLISFLVPQPGLRGRGEGAAKGSCGRLLSRPLPASQGCATVCSVFFSALHRRTSDACRWRGVRAYSPGGGGGQSTRSSNKKPSRQKTCSWTASFLFLFLRAPKKYAVLLKILCSLNFFNL
jgi:hypothetical protein